MDLLRLDPSAPFASLLSWLAAQLRALGIELPSCFQDIRLTRADAADVRFLLADWRRRLAALVRVRAALLAPRLVARLLDGVRLRGRAAPIRPRRDLAASPPRRRRPADLPRASAVGARGGSPLRPPALPARRDPDVSFDAPLNEDEHAALRRQTRGVLLALRDPRAAANRLARRLALRLARARHARIAAPGRRRFPPPPRVFGGRPLTSPAPEPRPPKTRTPALA